MLDGTDQAEGLRRMAVAAPLGVLAFPLADGPAGWIAQLAHALRALGRRPVVLDAGRGALAGAFGFKPRHELIDLLQGERGFDDVAQATRDGVYVLRGDRGLEAFVAGGAPAARLFAGFARLSHGFDSLLLAMSTNELASVAGPGRSVPVLGLEARPGGRLDAYAIAKQLAEGFRYRRFACVVRGAMNADHAADEHALLADAADRFLGVEVTLAGWLPPGGAGHGTALARTADTLLRTAAMPAAA
jgi:MinD-like ATPase involved in chromosome partitioning or flagellar assembly